MPLVDQDEEHLRLLSFVYYIQAGTMAFFGLFGLLYLTIGLVFSLNPPPSRPQDDPRMVGIIFTALGTAFFLFAVALTTTEFLTARYLKQRRHHTFCLVIAGLNCLWVPIGTALGVCTIIVLQRPVVKALFAGGSQDSSPQPPAIPPA